MAVPVEFLRGVLGLLCIFFAHVAGRTSAAVYGGRGRRSRAYSWHIRMVVCGGALLFRHEIDAVVIAVYVLAAAAYGAGWWLESRPKKEEDLTREIFPEDRE